MIHSEKQAFLSAIANDRYDEVTRKVYADWLSENGFDDEAMEQYTWTKEKQQAIDWLETLAGKEYYGYIVSAAKIYLDKGIKTNDPRMDEYLTPGMLNTFWECISLVLGKRILLQSNESCFYFEFDDEDRYDCGCSNYDDGYESCAC